MRYAIIKNDMVDNVIICDPDNLIEGNLILLSDSDIVSPGDLVKILQIKGEQQYIFTRTEKPVSPDDSQIEVLKNATLQAAESTQSEKIINYFKNVFGIS